MDLDNCFDFSLQSNLIPTNKGYTLPCAAILSS